MDRFEYIDARLFDGEEYLKRDKNVKIYDGDDKTQFVDGEVVLTSHRILWGKPGDIPKGNVCLSLYLYYVFCMEEESGGVFGLGGPKRIILHLGPALPGKRPGPAVVSLYHYIKLSFKDGIDASFYKALSDAVASKVWERPAQTVSSTTNSPNASPRPSTTPVNSKIRSGIVGIERFIEEQHRATDQSINVAFQDLTKLMEKAKEMVSISKNISNKIREKQGDISEDDTVRFKSYLMSLGIDDPVTRDAFRSDSDYYTGLAQQISDMMVAVLMDCGGIMSLADVWCRVNRARGLELVSPEDLLNACNRLQAAAEDDVVSMYFYEILSEDSDTSPVIENIESSCTAATRRVLQPPAVGYELIHLLSPVFTLDITETDDLPGIILSDRAHYNWEKIRGRPAGETPVKVNLMLFVQRLLQTIGAPMSLRKFPSGACVLQLNSHQDEEVAKSTRELLEEVGNLTPVKLSQLANVSVLLARERLYTTERLGLACRDESIEGLAFYPNRFLENVT